MKDFSKAFVLLLVLTCVPAVNIYVPYLPNTAYEKDGFFNLGIILPVHSRDSSLFTNGLVRDLGLLQRMEALAFAIEEINNHSTILPDYSLGFVMYDDCYHDLIALAQALRFARTSPPEFCWSSEEGYQGSDSVSPQHQCENTSLEFHDVIGVIGSESSITTVHSGNLLTVFQIPHISYLATTPILSSSKKYRMFQRTVPSDVLQVRAMVQLLMHFNWTYVSVLYSEGEYGFEAFRVLQQEADANGVCFAVVKELREDFTQADYNSLVHTLLLEKNATIVIVFAPQKETRMLMEASKKMIVDGRITWLASDAWARDMNEFVGLEEETRGLLSFNFHSKSVARFDEFFKTIQADTRGLNPWVDSFWQEYFDCSVTGDANMTLCDPDLKFVDHPDYQPDKLVSLVFDAVYTYAHGLHDVISEQCQNEDPATLPFLRCVRQHLPLFLKQVSFPGESGEAVIFDLEGNRKVSYDIFNVQNGTSGLEMVKVATWNCTSETLEMEPEVELEWARGEQPKSVCSDPCGVGEQQALQQSKCCWVCDPCQPNQYTRPWQGYERCHDCQEGTWPDEETRTTCEEIIPTYLSWDDPLGVFLALIASVGIILCICTTIFYLLHQRHPLIKACSRELSAVMMFGIIACYGFVYTFLLEPCDPVCFTTLFGVAIGFTLIYAPLTTRTIRIYRIFESGRNMNRKPKLVGAKSQLIISFAIILCHAVIIITWGLLDPPTVDEVESGPGQLEKICRLPTDLFATCIAYNSLLIIVCTFFAFKTRKLPDNFNESRFISFCVYATLVLFASFVPAYFAVNGSLLRVLFLSLMLIANASVALVTLFFPKIYALHYVTKEDMHVTPTIRRHGPHAEIMTGSVEESRRFSSDSSRVSLNKVSPQIPGWF